MATIVFKSKYMNKLLGFRTAIEYTMDQGLTLTQGIEQDPESKVYSLVYIDSDRLGDAEFDLDDISKVYGTTSGKSFCIETELAPGKPIRSKVFHSLLEAEEERKAMQKISDDNKFNLVYKIVILEEEL